MLRAGDSSRGLTELPLLALLCNLGTQLSTYDSDGSSGAILPGTPVVLAPDFKNYTDAKDGPLKAGTVGVVAAASGGRLQVRDEH
jgi:hypothetical protein